MTAPTPPAVAIADLLEYLDDGGLQFDGQPLPDAAASELLRLQAENERLRADQAQAMSEASSLAMSLFRKHYSSDPDYASGAVKFGLCDDLRGVISQIDNMSTGLARAELEARKPLPWAPQFDAMAPGQEELAIQFCAEIAGPRGQPGRNPDPVRLLEMAEALYKAEADARQVDKSPDLQEPLVDKTAKLQDRPAALIASREVVSDGPLRVTRLHLTEEGRAALTSKAAGPLPGITGGSS